MNTFSVADIARWVGGEIVGDGKVKITGCAGIKEARHGDITFVVNDKYASLAESSAASAIIVPRQVTLPGKVFIRVDNPSLAFTDVMRRILPDAARHFPKGIHPTAVVAADAVLGKGVALGPFTVVEAGASIGEGAVVYGHCYIGHKTSVGAQCLIYPGVILREEISVGNRVIIQPGAVLGSDGYGFVTVDGKHIKLPQVGTVIIEDDVEIGANVTIDRARFDKTVIGAGTKIDNLVHIAHNVIVGKHCLIVAQVGISGSTVLGNYVILAGQAGLIGHLKIGDGAVVAAQSGVLRDIKAGEQVFGSPSQPIREAFKNNIHVQKLGEYVQTIKELKKRIEELEKKLK